MANSIDTRLKALEEDKAVRDAARSSAPRDPDKAFVTRAELRAALSGDTAWLEPEETEPEETEPEEGKSAPKGKGK